jgi:hypothetical protein
LNSKSTTLIPGAVEQLQRQLDEFLNTKPHRLIADHSVTMADWVIEFESSVGSKTRIQWKASTAPDWLSLSRAWRESER